MARISVWFVRAALIHFFVGASAGAWMLAAKSGHWPFDGVGLRSLHVEVVLIGWVCQLAVGVALWILPFSRSVSEDTRLWAAWALLNGGIAGVVLGEWSGSGGLYVFGRFSELLAGGLLVWGLWPRLRPFPQRRE